MMILGIYGLIALTVAILLFFRAQWGTFAVAAILPVTPALPDTGIPVLNLTNLLIAVMAVGVFARRSRVKALSKGRFPAKKALAFFTIMILWGWANVTFVQNVPDVPSHAFNPNDVLWTLKDLATLALLMMIAYWSARNPAELQSHLLWMVVGSSVEVVSCIAEWVRTRDRIGGHVNQVNSLATYMAVACTIAIAFFLGSQRKARWIGLFVGIGAAFDCIETQSRGGILALVFGVLVITLIRSRGIFVLLLLAAVSYRLWLPGPVLERFDEAYTMNSSGSVQASDTAAKRVEIWKAGMRALADHPLGVGLTAYRQYSGGYATIGGEASQAGVDMTAHNEFVSLAVELSPLGLLAFLVLLGALARSALRCYSRGRGSDLEAVGLAALGALAAGGLANISGTFFFDLVTMGQFWLIVGFACRGDRMASETRMEVEAERAVTSEPEHAIP